MINFDAASNSRTSGGTSQSHSHTCSGSSLALVVAVVGDGTDKIVGVSYGGVAMTLVAKAVLGSARWNYLYYLANPATGANTVAASASSNSYIEINAASYTGVSASGQPGAFVTDTGTSSASSRSTSVTTVADASWVLGVAFGTSGAVTAGANTTRRTSNLVAAIMDSGGPVSPAGSRALAYSQASSSSIGAILMALAPGAAAGPNIVTQPAHATVTAPAAAAFSVSATASGGSLSYQWQRSTDGGANWLNVSSGTGGATNSYTTPATSVSGGNANNGDRYRCNVTDSNGTTTSNAAILTVNAAPTGPTINTQPGNQSVVAPATATFSVSAVTSGGPLSYQWQRNPGGNTAFANIGGATSSSYTTPATAVGGGSANNGDTYRSVVADSNGSVNSNAATLTVTAGAATFTSGVLARNNGSLVSGVTLAWLTFLNDATGAVVLTKTGVAVNGSGVFSIADPALVAGTTYSVMWKETTGQRGHGWAVAT